MMTTTLDELNDDEPGNVDAPSLATAPAHIPKLTCVGTGPRPFLDAKRLRNGQQRGLATTSGALCALPLGQLTACNHQP